MLAGLGSLALFTAKALFLVFIILFLMLMLLVIASRAREKLKGRLVLRNLNDKLEETKEALLGETLPKKAFKEYLKDKKRRLKAEKKKSRQKPTLFVLQFQGDIQASAVSALREEITAILSIATPRDEVVVKLESGGGMVHTYGLATAQLQRLRDRHIPLTIIVDKIAASGGYLMACVANRILAAPFAIIGSIGVIFQLPNFNRILQDKHVDFEQITAGNYKRTLTLFGKNTEEGREKLREELEQIHQQFKNVIQDYRRDLDVPKIATGEHWLGKQALELKLVDALSTSDDYLLQRSETATVYELSYETKKSLGAKFKMAIQQWMAKEFEPLLPMS
jgi:serine protease SohB